MREIFRFEVAIDGPHTVKVLNNFANVLDMIYENSNRDGHVQALAKFASDQYRTNMSLGLSSTNSRILMWYTVCYGESIFEKSFSSFLFLLKGIKLDKKSYLILCFPILSYLILSFSSITIPIQF